MRPFDGDIDRQDVLLGAEGARDPQRQLLVAGLHVAGRADRVLRLKRRDQLRAVDAETRELAGENSMKMRSSCAPIISILETSGTCSSRERTSST